MPRLDIIIEPDLRIEGGDLFVGPSDETNSLYITFAAKGQLRTNPLLGVGLVEFTNAPISESRSLAKALREEHNRDGYRIKNFEVEDQPDGSQTLSLAVVEVGSQ